MYLLVNEIMKYVRNARNNQFQMCWDMWAFTTDLYSQLKGRGRAFTITFDALGCSSIDRGGGVICVTKQYLLTSKVKIQVFQLLLKMIDKLML